MQDVSRDIVFSSQKIVYIHRAGRSEFSLSDFYVKSSGIRKKFMKKKESEEKSVTSSQFKEIILLYRLVSCPQGQS